LARPTGDQVITDDRAQLVHAIKVLHLGFPFLPHSGGGIVVVIVVLILRNQGAYDIVIDRDAIGAAVSLANDGEAALTLARKPLAIDSSARLT
jgi:hypothetical protein